MSNSVLIDRKEAAAILGLTPISIIRAEESGSLRRVELPLGRTGKPLRRVRYRRADILALAGVNNDD
jgi:hypothetical protein